MKMNENTQV